MFKIPQLFSHCCGSLLLLCVCAAIRTQSQQQPTERAVAKLCSLRRLPQPSNRGLVISDLDRGQIGHSRPGIFGRIS